MEIIYLLYTYKNYTKIGTPYSKYPKNTTTITFIMNELKFRPLYNRSNLKSRNTYSHSLLRSIQKPNIMVFLNFSKLKYWQPAGFKTFKEQIR